MNKHHSNGFTLIELSLAMTFISILLICIATLSIQLSQQYSRGITLKEVAQAGTEASSDIRRTMTQSQIGLTGVRTWVLNGASNGAIVLCTNSYSYIANNPNVLEDDSPPADRLVTVGDGTNTPVPARLIKVKDEAGTLCGSSSPLESNKELIRSDASELLSSGSRLLAVRELRVEPNGIPTSGPTEEEFKNGRGIYEVTLTISAGLKDELNVTGTDCRPPSDSASNADYCAIDSFRFTVRAGNSSRI